MNQGLLRLLSFRRNVTASSMLVVRMYEDKERSFIHLRLHTTYSDDKILVNFLTLAL